MIEAPEPMEMDDAVPTQDNIIPTDAAVILNTASTMDEAFTFTAKPESTEFLGTFEELNRYQDEERSDEEYLSDD